MKSCLPAPELEAIQDFLIIDLTGCPAGCFAFHSRNQAEKPDSNYLSPCTGKPLIRDEWNKFCSLSLFLLMQGLFRRRFMGSVAANSDFDEGWQLRPKLIQS